MSETPSSEGETFAMINGKRYPLRFGGYDRYTYRHREGCLAYDPLSPQGRPGQACQCGAAQRALKIYIAEVPGDGSSD